MKTRRIIALLLALVMICGVFVGCGKKEEAPAPQKQEEKQEEKKEEKQEEKGPEYEETVVVGYGSDTATFDPCMDSSTQLQLFTTLTFEGLTYYDSWNGKLMPMLATEWSCNDAATEWTFKLRQDVKSHDGKVFDADDVVFSIGRCTDGTQVKVPNSRLSSYVDKVEKVDQFTVKFTLKNPAFDFPVTMGARVMYSKDAFDAGLENAGYIGTGPYMFKEATVGVSYTATRFEDWWAGDGVAFDGYIRPTKNIMFKVLPEIDSQIAAMQAGEIDICLAARATDIPTLEADDKMFTDSFGGTTVYFLTWNGDSKWAKNQAVVDAVALAVNKDDMVEAMFSGTTDPTDSMMGNEFAPDFVKIENPVRQDYDAAKKLLADAGIKEGEVKLTIMFYAWCKPFAEMLQAELTDIGIVGEMKEIDGSVYRDLCTEGKYDITMTYCSNSPTYYYMLDRFYKEEGAGNWFYYHPTAEITAQFEKVQSAKTVDEVLAESAKLQQLCAADHHYIPLCLAPSIHSRRACVEGFKPTRTTEDLGTYYIQK